MPPLNTLDLMDHTQITVCVIITFFPVNCNIVKTKYVNVGELKPNLNRAVYEQGKAKVHAPPFKTPIFNVNPLYIFKTPHTNFYGQ